MAIVTVMFTDIVGSTALLDRLGDDVYEGLRRSHFATLEAAVAEFGGQVVKNLGDGLMVVFDSAANAVACAVACQQAVARQGRRRPDAIAVRVGLDVGEPTVQDGDYFGTPVVTAKRLCDAADGGEILVSSLVRDLVVRHRSHSFRPGTERELKGFGEPVLAYGVEWTNEGTDDADLPVALVMADAAPFVGRDDEFTTLTQLWKEASTGRGRTALLGGEPGVGKSRLAAQLARRASDDNSSVLYGRCDEGLGVSYQPFVEALRGFVAGCDDLTLRELVGNRAGVLVAFLPELAERLGAVDAPALAEPEAERLRLFEAVADLLDRASRQLPLVVVLDDLHWATAPTLLLLRHVVRSSAQSALLVIGTYRHTEVDNVHGLADLLADLRRDASVTRILLRGLDQAELTQYLQSAAGHQLDADGQELASLLYTQTEGNPFFVGEMLAHLVETGALVNQDGQWTAAGANPSDLGLPEGVREVIGRRVARLSAGAQQMLTMASMVGARFSLRTVELALGSDNDEVIDHLEEAMAAGLLDESDEGYMFAHALIRQAIHDDVSTVRRARMHRRIGEALEALPLSDERVEALALHYREATAASDPTKALTYAVEAARRANRRFAFEEAAATLEAAVDLVDGDESVDPSLVAELLLELSHTKATMGDLTGGTDLAFAAADAARRAANSGQLARAVAAFHREGVITAGNPIPGFEALALDALEALGDQSAAERSTVLGTLARYRFACERSVSSSVRLAQEALALARQSGNHLALARALSVSALVARGVGELPRQMEMLDELIPLAVEAEDIFTWEDGLAGQAYSFLSFGDLEAHDRAVEALEVLGNERRSWSPLASAKACRAGRASMAGNFDEAARLADEALAIAPTDPDFVVVWAALRLSMAFEQGDLDEVEPLLEGAVRDNPNLETFRIFLALIQATRGDHETALATIGDLVGGSASGELVRDSLFVTSLALLAELCGVVGGTRGVEIAGAVRPLLLAFSGTLTVVAYSGVCLGAVDRYLGIVEGLLGMVDEATAHFEAALVLEHQVESDLFVGHTSYWYAAFLRSTDGDASRVDELLATALTTAQRLRMGILESRARAV